MRGGCTGVTSRSSRGLLPPNGQSNAKEEPINSPWSPRPDERVDANVIVLHLVGGCETSWQRGRSALREVQ